MHDLSVIVTLAGALAVALALGWITRSLGLSTLMGYVADVYDEMSDSLVRAVRRVL